MADPLVSPRTYPADANIVVAAKGSFSETPMSLKLTTREKVTLSLNGSGFRRPYMRMKRTVLFASLVIALAPGCGNKQPATPPTPPTEATESGNTGTPKAPEEPPTAAPVPVPEASAAGGADSKATIPTADLNQLTAQLRTWMMNNRSGPPRSFEDWVARAHIQVAPPPAGKKYVITKTMWVALEDK